MRLLILFSISVSVNIIECGYLKVFPLTIPLALEFQHNKFSVHVCMPSLIECYCFATYMTEYQCLCVFVSLLLHVCAYIVLKIFYSQNVCMCIRV